MRTILVDDEEWGLKRFELECAAVDDIELVGRFQNPLKALEYARENRVDLAFLDIEMPRMNGLELYDRLKEIYPDMVAIFVSAYENYLPDAILKRGADYFITKPYTEEQVRSVIARAKLLSARQKKRVTVRTFGKFEVFADGKPLMLSPKAKELLAIIVDSNGDSVTAEYAFERMWSGKLYSHDEAGGFRNALVKLQKSLEKAEIENILIYYPHARALRCDMVECDYFDLMRGEPRAVRDYVGYYMSDYSWAEERIPFLNHIKRKYDPTTGDELYL